MPLATRKSLFVVKPETTYGTWTAPSGTDATIRFYRNGDSPILVPSREYTPLEKQGNNGTEGGIPEAGQVAISGFTHLRGKGASGMPALAKLFRASGMKFDATDTYETSSASSDWVSLSGVEYRDGRWTPGKGIFIAPTFNFSAGKACVINFTGMGGLKDAASAWSDASLVTGTYEAITPPVWQPTVAYATTCSLGGTALTASACTIALNNGLNMREGENAPAYAGFLGAWLDPTDPTVSIDPEAVLRAGLNLAALFESQAKMDFLLRMDGGDNNHFLFTATDCVLTAYPSEGGRGGRLVDAITLAATGGLKIKVVQTA